MPAARIVVLASGEGTLVQALMDSRIGDCVVAVGSDISGCGAVRRASEKGIETFVVAMQPDRAAWNNELLHAVRQHTPDWVVSAGFMRILGPTFIDEFDGRVVNTHPSLLPSFPGSHAVRDALDYGVRVTGCTVHLVDAGVDTGPVVAQQPVFVEVNDDEASLHERIKSIERVLLVDVLEQLVEGRLQVSGRSVRIT